MATPSLAASERRHQWHLQYPESSQRGNGAWDAPRDRSTRHRAAHHQFIMHQQQHLIISTNTMHSPCTQAKALTVYRVEPAKRWSLGCSPRSKCYTHSCIPPVHNAPTTLAHQHQHHPLAVHSACHLQLIELSQRRNGVWNTPRYRSERHPAAHHQFIIHTQHLIISTSTTHSPCTQHGTYSLLSRGSEEMELGMLPFKLLYHMRLVAPPNPSALGMVTSVGESDSHSSDICI